MVKKEKIIEKLKTLLKDNDVEHPNFETATWLKKGIEEIIEQEAEQDSKKGKLFVTINPSGVLNASKIILPKIIENGLKKMKSEKEEQEDKPKTIEEAYKSCPYLENICKESLSPNEECNENCRKELHQLNQVLIRMINLKKDMTQDQIDGVFGDTQNSKVICECGHEEGVHHHHMDYAWGAGSLCTRCTECIWDMNKGCYTFKKRKIK